MGEPLTYYDSDKHLAHQVRATRLEHASGMHGNTEPALCSTCHAAWNNWNLRRVRNGVVPVAGGSCLGLVMWLIVIGFVALLVL